MLNLASAGRPSVGGRRLLTDLLADKVRSGRRGFKGGFVELSDDQVRPPSVFLQREIKAAAPSTEASPPPPCWQHNQSAGPLPASWHPFSSVAPAHEDPESTGTAPPLHTPHREEDVFIKSFTVKR